MRQSKVNQWKTKKAKDLTRDLHDFGAAAYVAALRFYAEHHRNPRALARYMRRLEA